MGKCLTAGMLGFLLGMKCKESGKHFCARQLMKMVGLK